MYVCIYIYIYIATLSTTKCKDNKSPKDRLGNTPFDDAVRHHHVETRKVLQSHRNNHST